MVEATEVVKVDPSEVTVVRYEEVATATAEPESEPELPGAAFR